MIAAGLEESQGLEVWAGISTIANTKGAFEGGMPVSFERLSFRAFSHRSSAVYMVKTLNVDHTHYLSL